jgi:hypothetical protein
VTNKRYLNEELTSYIVFSFVCNRFVDALRLKLEAAFPDTVRNVNNTEIIDIVHVHYKDFNYIVEYTPLFVTYFVLLLYIYFSVREYFFIT